MPDARTPTASAMSPPSSQQMPPGKRAKLDPPSATNSPGPSQSFTQPLSQSAAASMSMPPPSSTSPIQKPTDTKELSDVLFSTGVDLQAEEQYLYNDTPAVSFNASTLLGPGLQAEERALNRQEAERSGKNRHNEDPFLSSGALQKQINDKLVSLQIRSSGEPGHFSELISIATQERVRELVTTAYTYARHRRQGNTLKGFGEWADIAIGESEGRNGRLRPDQEPESAISPGTINPRKRSFSVANAASQSTRQPSLISETAKSLRQIALDERLIEEARLNARIQRLNGSKPQTPAAILDPNAPESANSPIGLVAPEPEKKLTAKEAKKAQNSKLDEIQSHKAANETASLMLGRGRKNKYSWMSAGPGGGGTGSGTSTPVRLPGTPGAAPAAVSTPVVPARPTMYWSKRMGEWNEQGERGKGIQLRDWTLALESDGREKKTLVKSYLKMK